MDFHRLSRRELQKLCKKNKIKANMTNVAMADALKSLQKIEDVDDILLIHQSQDEEQQEEKMQASRLKQIKLKDLMLKSPNVIRRQRTPSVRKTMVEEMEIDGIHLVIIPDTPEVKESEVCKKPVERREGKENREEDDSLEQNTNPGLVTLAYSRRSKMAVATEPAIDEEPLEVKSVAKISSDEITAGVDDSAVAVQESGILIGLSSDSLDMCVEDHQLSADLHAIENSPVKGLILSCKSSSGNKQIGDGSSVHTKIKKFFEELKSSEIHQFSHVVSAQSSVLTSEIKNTDEDITESNIESVPSQNLMGNELIVETETCHKIPSSCQQSILQKEKDSPSSDLLNIRDVIEECKGTSGEAEIGADVPEVSSVGVESKNEKEGKIEEELGHSISRKEIDIESVSSQNMTGKELIVGTETYLKLPSSCQTILQKDSPRSDVLNVRDIIEEGKSTSGAAAIGATVGVESAIQKDDNGVDSVVEEIEIQLVNSQNLMGKEWIIEPETCDKIVNPSQVTLQKDPPSCVLLNVKDTIEEGKDYFGATVIIGTLSEISPVEMDGNKEELPGQLINLREEVKIGEGCCPSPSKLPVNFSNHVGSEKSFDDDEVVLEREAFGTLSSPVQITFSESCETSKFAEKQEASDENVSYEWQGTTELKSSITSPSESLVGQEASLIEESNSVTDPSDDVENLIEESERNTNTVGIEETSGLTKPVSAEESTYLVNPTMMKLKKLSLRQLQKLYRKKLTSLKTENNNGVNHELGIKQNNVSHKHEIFPSTTTTTTTVTTATDTITTTTTTTTKTTDDLPSTPTSKSSVDISVMSLRKLRSHTKMISGSNINSTENLRKLGSLYNSKKEVCPAKTVSTVTTTTTTTVTSVADADVSLASIADSASSVYRNMSLRKLKGCYKNSISASKTDVNIEDKFASECAKIKVESSMKKRSLLLAILSESCLRTTTQQ